MLKTRPWSDDAAARTLLLAVAILTLTASAFAGWRLLGVRETDSYSERFAFSDALSIADGHHKFGIVGHDPQPPDYPSGASYILVPWMKLGIRNPYVLRRVPFAIGLLCEGLLLAAIAVLRVSFARRLWLLLALGTIYLQPGVTVWLGCLHEHSYVLSCSFVLLAAAAAMRHRFRSAVFALFFLSGWLGYDFIIAQFCGMLAIRWLVHCRDSSDGDLAIPIWETGLDGLSAGVGACAAVLTHLLQNAGYYGSFTVAVRNLAGAAVTRMSLQIGAKINPQYYNWAAAVTLQTPSRFHLLRAHLTAFFSAGWVYPSQFALLGVGGLLAAAASRRRISLDARNAARLGIFLVCVFFCVGGWIFLMPEHAANHLTFLPRHFFVAATVLTLASVMLPDALSGPVDRPQTSPTTVWNWKAPSLRALGLPALKIFATLGIFFSILNMSSLWAVAKGSTLRWRILILFGALMSGWALAVRLNRRPGSPGKRLAGALLIGSSCLSVYALYCLGGEFLSSHLSGLTIFLSAITAVMVVWKHESERKLLGLSGSIPRSGKALVALALLLVCGMAWIETGRLMFWATFSDWVSGDWEILWKAVFLCALVPVLLLWDPPRSASWRRRGLLVLDVLAVLVLFVFAFEKDMLLAGGGDFNYPVFIAPVDYLRSGGHLLWDVPSQYGFLNIQMVSALKMFKPAEALYLVNSTLIFLGTLVSYTAFRLAWPALGAPLVGIPLVVATSILVPGMAPATFSPQLFPSDGPFRYMICYLLILLLLLQQSPGWKERLPVRRVMRLGSGIWLLGCLWSAESSAYCTAIWFPALLLLDGQMRHEDRTESPWRAFVHSANLLRFPALLLGGAMAILSLDYLLRIGHFPDFKGYYDYALSYKGGFTANPVAPDIADHWLVLFFFSNFLVLAYSVKSALKPLAAAALFAVWAVSSYYAALSYPHSLLNLIPLSTLALHTLTFVLRVSPVRGEWDLFARSMLRAVLLALAPFILLVYLHDPASIEQRAVASLRSLRQPFTTPSQLRWNGEPEPVTPFISPSDMAMRTSLTALLLKEFNPDDARCVISLQNYWENDPPRQELWAPFLSTALVWPLSLDVRLKYWDRFMARVNSAAPSGKCSERWVAYNDQILDPERYMANNDQFWQDAPWKLQYLQKTMRIERTIDSGGWHLVKLSPPIPGAHDRPR